MIKKKINALLVMAALVLISGQTWAAFPVQKAKTEQVQGNTTSTPQNTVTPSETENTVANVKSIKKETKKTLMQKFREGGKSQLVALLLAIFVGAIGIHRFYLGYTWQGIVQILTLGGCGIWALIDLIRIATGDLQPKDGSYDKTL